METNETNVHAKALKSLNEAGVIDERSIRLLATLLVRQKSQFRLFGDPDRDKVMIT